MTRPQLSDGARVRAICIVYFSDGALRHPMQEPRHHKTYGCTHFLLTLLRRFLVVLIGLPQYSHNRFP
jgi:hypothetical protein